MRCSPQFQHKSSGFNLLKLPQLLWSFIPHKPPKVVMFGPGLESNTSTLVRKFLGNESDVFKVRGVFPAELPGSCKSYQYIIFYNLFCFFRIYLPYICVYDCLLHLLCYFVHQMVYHSTPVHCFRSNNCCVRNKQISNIQLNILIWEYFLVYIR